MPTARRSTGRPEPPAAAWSPSVVVLEAEVGDEVFSSEEPQRVLQLHQLNEQVVLRVEPRGMHRALEIEREPLLDAAHPGPARQVEEQCHVEHDRRGENAVAAEEVDLQLHPIAEPSEDVDVVPTLFVV